MNSGLVIGINGVTLDYMAVPNLDYAVDIATIHDSITNTQLFLNAITSSASACGLSANANKAKYASHNTSVPFSVMVDSEKWSIFSRTWEAPYNSMVTSSTKSTPELDALEHVSEI